MCIRILCVHTHGFIFTYPSAACLYLEIRNVPGSVSMLITVPSSPVEGWGSRNCLRDQLEISPHQFLLPRCLSRGNSARVSGHLQAWGTRVRCVCACMVRVGHACSGSGSDNLGSGQLIPETSGPCLWLVQVWLLWLKATSDLRWQKRSGHPSWKPDKPSEWDV